MARAPISRRVQAYRNALKNNLLTMSETLRDECDICRNPGILGSAASSITTDSFRSGWGYTLLGLIFEIETPRKSQPSLLPPSLIAILDMNIRSDEDPNDPSHDPFSELNIDIRITAEHNGSNWLETWHLDRHITGDGSGNPPLLAHPLYHLQRGGNHMTSIGDNTGNTMILESPRIAHPPMDAILAIDYLLSHYAGEHWRIMRKDERYRRVVRDSQRMLWSGNAGTIAAHWGSSIPSSPGNRAVDLIPQLLS